MIDKTEITRLRALAVECIEREIDFGDVSPNQGSTSCDKLVRTYIASVNPESLIALLDAAMREQTP